MLRNVRRLRSNIFFRQALQIYDLTYHASPLLPSPRKVPPRRQSVIMPMRGKRKSSTLAESPAAAADDLATIVPRLSKRRASPRDSNPAVPGHGPVQDLENVAKVIAGHPKAKLRVPRKGSSKDEGTSNGVAAVERAVGEKLPNGTIEEASKTVDEAGDPDTEAVGPAVEEEVKEALSRPPPVNSDYLPLPWKGRLGYACLNTYLRSANPQVFSSRTCRIKSILDHRHPLQNPNEPEHATKNRPDKTKPAEKWRGQKYVEELGLANARDIAKMVRWNDRYGIKFMRLSSEMFPFASHEEYGYKLAPFASETLAEAGRVAGRLGHRLTTHPGQVSCLWISVA
jgi:UV DNA damage endonuclease